MRAIDRFGDDFDIVRVASEGPVIGGIWTVTSASAFSWAIVTASIAAAWAAAEPLASRSSVAAVVAAASVACWRSRCWSIIIPPSMTRPTTPINKGSSTASNTRTLPRRAV